MSNKPPIEVPQGAIRLNTDSQKLEFFAQDRWHEMATETASGLGGRAFRAGAGSGGTTISTWNIATEGNAIDTGFDLSTGVHAMASAGSRTRAVQAGGRSSSGSPYALQNVIQYFEMASVSNTIDFGDLTRAAGRHEAHSNNVRMVTGGQQNGTDNTMELIIIPSTGNATDFGNLTHSSELTTAAGSRTRAIYAGGASGSSPYPDRDIIDFVTIATTGNAIDFGNLTQARYAPAGMSNNTRAAFAQGNVAPTQVNTIDFVTIASTGNAQDFGDAGLAQMGAGAFSSPIRCGFFGGYGNPTPSTTKISVINITSKGNSTFFGDLSTGGTYNGGHSDCHGGL